MRISSRLRALTLTSSLLFGPLAPAQTLARPNWAGSGLTAEPWWHNAVFYRIHPDSFQDSDSDGTGDLRGIAQRLDYLQSLGIDAIVLEPPFDAAGFDDLLAAASPHHIRLIVALQPSANLLSSARAWLTRGPAGIELLAPTNTDPLRQLAHTFPGERVILSSRGPDLVSTTIATGPTDNLTANLRQSLAAAQMASPLLLTDEAARSAFLYASDDPQRTLALNKTLAAMLLASRGAASLLYGQELGLDKPDLAAIMQWTPSNVTPPPAQAMAEPPKPAPRNPNTYGAYVPYVAPKKITLPAFDPNTLPGFSTRKLTSGQQDDLFVERSFGSSPQLADATHNVALEERDDHSLLNFYKRLLQLHHGNPALRDGTQTLFNHDADNLLVWARRAPAGARTSEPVVIVCNLSSQTVFLSLNDDLGQLHIRPGALRTLLSSATVTPIETTDRFRLPPYTVYIGELER